MHSTRPRAQSPMRATDQQQTGVVVQQALLGLSVLLQLLEPSGRLLLNGMHVHPHAHSTGAPAICLLGCMSQIMWLVSDAAVCGWQGVVSCKHSCSAAHSTQTKL